MPRTETHSNEYTGQFSTERYYDEHQAQLMAVVRHRDYSLEIRACGRSGQIIAEVDLGPHGSVKAALAAADAYVATATVESIRSDAKAREAARKAEIASRWAAQPQAPDATNTAPASDWDDISGARMFSPRR